MIKALDPKKKFYLTLGISVLAILVFCGTVNYFLFFKVIENSKNYLDAKKELLELFQKQQQAGELEKIYLEKEAVLGKIDNVLVDPQNLIELILLIENITERSGNSAPGRDFTFSGEKEGPSFFFSSRTLSGDFQGLMKFLKLFENMRFYGDIDSINIKKTGVSEGGTPQLSTTINFKIYSR